MNGRLSSKLDSINDKVNSFIATELLHNDGDVDHSILANTLPAGELTDTVIQAQKYNVHDIDGFQGSWGVLEPDSIQHNNNNNESEHTAPSTTTTITPPQPNTIQYYEPTVLHLNTAYDYQNRSYLFTPTSIHYVYHIAGYFYLTYP